MKIVFRTVVDLPVSLRGHQFRSEPRTNEQKKFSHDDGSVVYSFVIHCRCRFEYLEYAQKERKTLIRITFSLLKRIDQLSRR